MRGKLKIIICVILVALTMLICNVFDVKSLILKKIYPKKYEEYVEVYSIQSSLDPLLVYSIIKAESNFKSDAKSSSGAQGLMQIIESTAEELQLKNEGNVYSEIDLYDVEKNIMYGTQYYSYLLEHYNGIENVALAAYNAGMGNVDRWIQNGTIKADGTDIENIPFKETNMYVRKILNNYEMYKELYDK